MESCWCEWENNIGTWVRKIKQLTMSMLILLPHVINFIGDTTRLAMFLFMGTH